MSIELQDFYKDFFQEVVGYSETGEFMENAFTNIFCNYLIDAGEFDTFDTAYYKAVKGMKVDGYAGDPIENDGVLTLVISDFHEGDEPQSLTKTQIDTIFKRLVNFYNACLQEDFYVQMEETSSGYGLAQLISSRQYEISRIRLFLVSNRLLSGRVTGMDNIQMGGKPASYNVWDISRLHRLVASRKTKEDIKIDLIEEFGEGLPCLPAHGGGDAYEAYLAVIPGPMLAALYEKWGTRLLEQNVRCFLQIRGKTNQGIRNTILNDPDMFFAYNNGITATAEAVTTSDIDGVTRIDALQNLQIVNGGQTTASIFTAKKKDSADLSHIFVQMKLSVIDPVRAEKVVPKISQYANTQNTVNAADFFANHPFHVRMEEFSRRIWAKSRDGTFRETKWFYERARGQYLDAKTYLTPTQKKQFDAQYPKIQSFTKTDLAKFENVWECIPHIVSKGAQANFAHFAKLVGKRWDVDETQFNERYFCHAMARALLFHRCERLVSAQPWYEGGYRANIVAYTLSKFADLVHETGKAVDFQKIWLEQTVSDELVAALASIAEPVQKAILNTPEGMRNISEWAKKESCWEQVKALDISLPGNFKNQLISLSQVKAQKGEARKIQKIDNGIEAQQRVIELGAEFWTNCLEWAREQKVLSETEHQIMAVACSIPNRIPTELQCIRLSGILVKLADEACPHVAALQ